MREALTEHDIMALEFLMLGPDQPGVIDCEEKLCATLFFIELEKRGLVHMDRDEGGPVFTISTAGRSALAALEGGEEL
jgi:hypothetical protein